MLINDFSFKKGIENFYSFFYHLRLYNIYLIKDFISHKKIAIYKPQLVNF